MSYEHPDSFDNTKVFPDYYIESTNHFTITGKIPDISYGDDRIIFWLKDNKDNPDEEIHVMVFNEDQWQKLKKMFEDIDACFTSPPKPSEPFRVLVSTPRGGIDFFDDAFTGVRRYSHSLISLMRSGDYTLTELTKRVKKSTDTQIPIDELELLFNKQLQNLAAYGLVEERDGKWIWMMK